MKAILTPLTRAEDWVGVIEETLLVLAVVGLGLVVNLQIFARYLFGAPFIWPEEVARILMIWMAFLGSAAVTRRGADMAVDTFVLMLPPGGQRLLAILRDVVMVALFGFVALLAHRLAAAVANMPLIATELPTAVIVWPLMLGAGLTALHSALRLLRLVFLPESAPPHTEKTLT